MKAQEKRIKSLKNKGHKLEGIDDELSDMEVMNEMCADKMTIDVTEDKDNLKITTVSTYIK